LAKDSYVSAGKLGSREKGGRVGMTLRGKTPGARKPKKHKNRRGQGRISCTSLAIKTKGKAVSEEMGGGYGGKKKTTQW